MIGKLRSYHSQLPKELDYYYVWLPDCGHSIMCVLSQHIDDARKGEITDYMLPIPVKYVLEKGYIVHPDCIEVKAQYVLPMGLYIDGDYEEW
ncbi:hypothetical protein [Bacillus sp. MB2021]|uniref:hypothetical protein n=1 Tax=Bacillus sp. MB2021 TaxID=1408303 RepID=UPI0004E22381|nr:hypothetical protein [Bacillus sp. MB2021]